MEDDARLEAAGDMPARGRLERAGPLLLCTVDRRTHPGAEGQSSLLGVGAVVADPPAPAWTRWGVPPLAAVGDQAYAYGRAGLLVALALDGAERWRAALPDDRSPARAKNGDPAAPFVADAVPIADAVFVAAGREVLALDARDGAIRARSTVCRSERGVIARLARGAGGDLIVTCTDRSAADDEAERVPPLPWHGSPAPVSLRTGSGDLVSLDTSLRERWRLAATADAVHGDTAPVPLDDGGLLCVAANVLDPGGERRLDLRRSWLFVVDPGGRLRWRRELDGGFGQPDPTAVPGGLVAGFDPTLFAAPDGRRIWTLDAGRHHLDRTAPRPLHEGRLVAVGAGELVAVSLRDGAACPLARFGPPSSNVTTPLLFVGSRVFFGLALPGAPVRLVAITPAAAPA